MGAELSYGKGNGASAAANKGILACVVQALCDGGHDRLVARVPKTTDTGFFEEESVSKALEIRAVHLPVEDMQQGPSCFGRCLGGAKEAKTMPKPKNVITTSGPFLSQRLVPGGMHVEMRCKTTGVQLSFILEDKDQGTRQGPNGHLGHASRPASESVEPPTRVPRASPQGRMTG